MKFNFSEQVPGSMCLTVSTLQGKESRTLEQAASKRQQEHTIGKQRQVTKNQDHTPSIHYRESHTWYMSVQVIA